MTNDLSSPTNNPINLALIYGSVREGRLCDTVANWTAGEISLRREYTLDVIDPAKLDLPMRQVRSEVPAVTALKQRIAHADAFIIVTPEYNHGYTAALKHVIDSVSLEWQTKPVGFVSYGGMSGGLRAVEQLRLVFAELHAVTMRDSVSFSNIWQRFNSDGTLREPDRSRKTLSVMLAQLSWWANALRIARSTTPYGETAA